MPGASSRRRAMRTSCGRTSPSCSVPIGETARTHAVSRAGAMGLEPCLYTSGDRNPALRTLPRSRRLCRAALYSSSVACSPQVALLPSSSTSSSATSAAARGEPRNLRHRAGVCPRRRLMCATSATRPDSSPTAEAARRAVSLPRGVSQSHGAPFWAPTWAPLWAPAWAPVRTGGPRGPLMPHEQWESGAGP